MSLSSPSFKCLAFLAAAIIPAALISGCGVGTPAASNTPIAGMSGIAHGGPNPVVGSTVTLYATTTAGYGAASTQLAQATTDGNGYFSFTGAAACPVGQQAYVTAVGGNTGANANNPNVMLMSALGPCSNLGTNSHIAISEISTVAAGYALSNFIGISGSTVNVSAPASNNAPVSGCTGTGATLICKSSGLAHAFLNAANLVDVVSKVTQPTGVAFTSVPGNTNSTVPALLINTLGNILQSCVNSTGGVAGDATNCGKLFTNTTPPATSTTTPVTPTNTLQAVLNLAKFPSMAPAQITALYALATPQTFFNPSLAAAPADFSLAIAYKGPTSAINYQYAFFTITDINDTTYTFAEAANGGTGSTSVIGMSSNGASGFQGPVVSAIACNAGSPCAGAVDSLGNIWLANSPANGAQGFVYEFSSTDGTLTNTFTLPAGTSANSAAVDKFNNVFVTSANNTANNLFELPVGGSAFVPVVAGGVAETQTVASPEYIAIAQDGSIWNTNYNSTNVTVTYTQNTAGINNAPVFANPNMTSTISTSTPPIPTSPYGISFDAAHNVWINGTTTLFELTPGASTPTQTLTISGIGGNSSTTPKAAASARFHAQDGDGNIFLPENATPGIVFQYLPSTGNFIYLSPCTGATGSACITTGQHLAVPRNAVIDATGSIWVSNPSATVANGNVSQIIGTAAPLSGQASYTRSGVRP